MLQQLEFKLSVEAQYKRGIEKMINLYQMEGDKRSKTEAEANRMESAQKIQLLAKSRKRYSDMHIGFEEDVGDDESISMANLRRPLSGNLHISCLAIKDVDHVTTARPLRGPESMVTVKVENMVHARTRLSRNEKWHEEFNIAVDKANEIELTVYDKVGDQNIPVGLVWLRISDIAEAIRRRKVEQELNNAGWVSASKVQATAPGAYSGSSGGNNLNPGQGGRSTQASYAGSQGANPAQQVGDSTSNITIDSWFVLEPTGQIHLSLGFEKTSRGQKRQYDGVGGLGRQGAIRQKKDEIHEMHGHQFVQQQFYNIMKCALCGDFLKYAGGYQCLDCKYTCHKKCYPKVVTKCISRASTDTDPDEEKLNHRIPHRFEPTTNMSANWCCHCGYILPLGKKNVRKCTECGSTCHSQCVHLVPDFCGMPMEVANKILSEIKATKDRKATAPPVRKVPQIITTPPDGTPSSPNARYNIQSPVNQQRQPASPPTPYQQGYNQQYQQTPYQQQNQDYSRPTVPAQSAQRVPIKRKEVGSSASTVSDSTNSLESGLSFAPSPTEGYKVPVTSSNPPEPNRAPIFKLPSQTPLVQVTSPSHAEQEATFREQEAAFREQQHANQTQVMVPSQAQSPVSPRRPRRKVGLDDFSFLSVLGKGNFGKVMLAETRNTKQLYAIKVLKKDFIIENDEIESTRSEKRVLLIASKERHPFLLTLHSCFQTENRVYFVMDYVSGGDLMWHIQQEPFTPRRAQFYAAEVLLGLKYFHENGVIYRDLKLDNILLTLTGHVKIADYGLCKEDMGYGNTTGTFCGTPEFMAPEILLEQKYGRGVDWWAFGVLIYQMLLGQSPFRGEDDEEVFDAILGDEPLYPIHMPRDSVSILQGLLTRELDKRLGCGPDDAKDIMSHAYFKNINFDDIYHCRVPPPYVPNIDSPTDVKNFDQEFTNEVPTLTPVNSTLTPAMQEQFRGFSYLNGESAV